MDLRSWPPKQSKAESTNMAGANGSSKPPDKKRDAPAPHSSTSASIIFIKQPPVIQAASWLALVEKVVENRLKFFCCRLLYSAKFVVFGVWFIR